MPRLIWSPASLADIHRLYLFLEAKDAQAAGQAVRAIRREANILDSQPQAGRPMEGMDPEFREWLVDFGNSGYIILYHFDGETAVVLRVRHQREAGY
jgi:plasmid stabilization system protein ParE